MHSHLTSQTTKSNNSAPFLLPASYQGIKLAKLGDEFQICEIHNAAIRANCSSFYHQSQIEDWIMSKEPDGYLDDIMQQRIFVYMLDQQIVAFAHLEDNKIEALYCSPKFQNQGIGREMLKYVVESVSLQDKYEEVILEATLNAKSFYEKQNFIPCSNSKVRVGEDTFIATCLMKLKF